MGNNKNNFFFGAGFDETNQNNPQMQSNNMFGGMQQPNMNNQTMMNQPQMMDNNQGMMNNQMMSDNMFGGMQQPNMNNQGMMSPPPMMDSNQGMFNNQMMTDNMFGGMQQPNMSNQGMMNPMPDNIYNGMQPYVMNGQGGAGQVYKKNKFSLNLNSVIVKVGITIGIIVAVLVLVIVFCHKTLSCTQEMENGEFTIVMTAEVDYWFGKATSRTAIMSVDYEDLDDEDKDQIVEYLKEIGDATKEDEDGLRVRVKSTNSSAVLTIKKKISSDNEASSYKKERKDFIDSDYVCK